jgi:hypothetical protein
MERRNLEPRRWAQAGRVLVLATVALAVATTPACGKKKRKGGGNNEGLTGGVLVLSDDFQRESVGDQYLTKSTKWSIVDGWLHIQGDRNEGLWLTAPLPERVRVEFDARSMTPEGDIKCEVFNAEPRHSTGYIAVLGGWKNALSVLARLDEHGVDRMESDVKVDIGKVHHFALVRTEGSLRWYLDGKLILAYPDDAPLQGKYFGFNNWNSDIYFDNLAIYRL